MTDKLPKLCVAKIGKGDGYAVEADKMPDLTELQAHIVKRRCELHPELAKVAEAMAIEAQRYHTILSRLAGRPGLWDELARGTGCATLNGYNRRLEELQDILSRCKEGAL